MFEHQILHCAQFTDQRRDLETISTPVLHTLNLIGHTIQSNSFIPNTVGVCKLKRFYRKTLYVVPGTTFALFRRWNQVSNEEHKF